MNTAVSGLVHLGIQNLSQNYGVIVPDIYIVLESALKFTQIFNTEMNPT